MQPISAGSAVRLSSKQQHVSVGLPPGQKQGGTSTGCVARSETCQKAWSASAAARSQLRVRYGVPRSFSTANCGEYSRSSQS